MKKDVPDPSDVTIIRRYGEDAAGQGAIAFWEIFRGGIAEARGISTYTDAVRRGSQLAESHQAALWYVHEPERQNHDPELLANHRHARTKSPS